MVQQQALQYAFEDGIVEQTLRYYSKKLVQICVLSPTYQAHLLSSLASLCDASKSKLVNNLIYCPLLQSFLTQSLNSHTGNGNDGRTPATLDRRLRSAVTAAATLSTRSWEWPLVDINVLSTMNSPATKPSRLPKCTPAVAGRPSS